MDPIIIPLGIAAVAVYAYLKAQVDDDQADDQADEDEPLIFEAESVDPVDPEPSYELLDPAGASDENEGFPTGPKPPNQGSGSQPYDHSFYPEGFVSVRKALAFMGYQMGYQNEMPPAQLVRNFQYDYNLASEAGFMQAQGFLLIDGVPGNNTLNALQLVATGGGAPGPDDVIRGSVWKTEYELWD